MPIAGAFDLPLPAFDRKKLPITLNKKSGLMSKKTSKFDQGTGLDSMMNQKLDYESLASIKV